MSPTANLTAKFTVYLQLIYIHYKCPAHHTQLFHIKFNLRVQELMWFECSGISKEEPLSQFML